MNKYIPFSLELNVYPPKREEQILKFNLKDANHQEIANYLSILDFHGAEILLKYSWNGTKKLTIKGVVSADITQECGLTLKPIKHNLKFEFKRVFKYADKVLESKPDDIEDDPDILNTNNIIDVGEVVIEELILVINPYFKSDDATFIYENEQESKFAILKNLIK